MSLKKSRAHRHTTILDSPYLSSTLLTTLSIIALCHQSNRIARYFRHIFQNVQKSLKKRCEMDKENKLKNLKDLFSRFESFVSDSNHKTNVWQNGQSTNLESSNNSTFSSPSANFGFGINNYRNLSHFQTEIGNSNRVYCDSFTAPSTILAQTSIIEPALFSEKCDLELVRSNHSSSVMTTTEQKSIVYPQVFNIERRFELVPERNRLTSVASATQKSIPRPPTLSGICGLELVPGLTSVATATQQSVSIPPVHSEKFDLELAPSNNNCISGNGKLHHHLSNKSFPVNNSMCGNGFCSNDMRDGYQNALDEVNRVMGVELPCNSDFDNDRLEHMLNNSTSDASLTNYFYYLPPLNDERNLTNINETENELQNCVWNECDSIRNSTVETSNKSNITVSEQPIDSTSPTPSPLIDVNVRVMSKKSNRRGRPKRNKIEQPCSINVEPRTRCDNAEMFVPTSDSKAKKLCCFYCHKRYRKLARHLESVHKNEDDIRKLQDLPTGSKERQDILTTIRKRGQFLWNGDEKLNRGELSTTRRPTHSTDAVKFSSCPKCLGSYKERTLRKHWNECTKNPMKGERIVKQLSLTVERRVHPDACDELNEQIFARMQNQALVRLIRYDWLVVAYGNNLCLNYHENFDKKFIKKNLGEAGKLLLMAKSVSTEITDFASMYHVKCCNIVVESIQKVSRFDLKAKTVGAPSTAAALRTLVNNIGQVLLIETMKLDDPEKEKIVERFLKVFNSDAKLKISKLVAVTQANAKRFKQEIIPDTDDVSRLADYLDRERDKCYVELSQVPAGLSLYSSDQYKQYEHLSELTLASILVFNRKRVGELQNATIAAFQHREMITEETGLGVITKETANLIRSRMTIRGKRSSTVRLLLKHAYEDCITFLLNHRKKAGISENNKYLFAQHTQSGEIKVVNGCAAIKKFSELCGAQNPASLRGTYMRKHMASFCGTLNLSDNDVTNVAKFMGHSDKIHRDVYRHNSLQREVVQMTALLQAAQGKAISNVKLMDEQSGNGDGQSRDDNEQTNDGDGQWGDSVGKSGDDTKRLKCNINKTKNQKSENRKKPPTVRKVKGGGKRVAKKNP